MGILYAVVCKKCNIKRDLDKLSVPVVADRQDALQKFSDSHHFRPLLLVAFMVEHAGHDCVLVNDLSGESLFYDTPLEAKEFWKDSQEPPAQ